MAETEPRFRRRMPCRIFHGPREHAGVVLDVSRTGLFVQTSAAPGPGEPLELKLRAPRVDQDISLRAEVVWQKKVPSQLRTLVEGGIGVRIRAADEEYFRLLAGFAQNEAPATRSPEARQKGAAAAAAPVQDSFRVRIVQTGGPRSRWIACRAKDAAEAKRIALGRAGDGWEVAEVDELEA